MSPISADLSIAVMRTLSDVHEMLALRAAMYMSEQECPFFEEFDGNDFAGSTHLIARIGGEPAGAIRIRWFADFAKLERACVVKRFRGRAITVALAQRACEIAAAKGYRRILGHIEPGLASFWKQAVGFEVRAQRPSFVFSDRLYVEIEAPISPAEDALTIDSPPLVILRPEGAWRQEGVLDRSVERGAALAQRRFA